MAKIRRVDFSPDEFLAGVSNLKHDEIGPYWVACCLMYSRGGSIPDDDAWIAKACGAHVRTWRAIKTTLIAKGKLTLIDGRLSNGRSLREIERAQGRLKGSRDAAEASVKARRERAENADLSNDYNEIPEASASDYDGAIQQPSTINEQPTKNLFGENLTTAPAGAGADGRDKPVGPQKAKAEARGTRLPDGWQPGPELEQFARDLGLDPAKVTPEFVDYWRGAAGQRARKLDWPATYRNRCRELSSRPGVRGVAHPQRSSGGGRMAALQAVRERFQREKE